MQIRGKNGDLANVGGDGLLTVASISTPEDRNLNESGKVFSVYFTVTPTAADDYFFYLKNNGTKNILVTDIRVTSTVATKVYYKSVSGTPAFVVGTAAAATNRNLGSSSELDATATYDADITGLTDNGVLFFESCDTVANMESLKTSSTIIIPQGQAIAFQREAATGEIEVLVSVVEDS